MIFRKENFVAVKSGNSLLIFPIRADDASPPRVVRVVAPAPGGEEQATGNGNTKESQQVVALASGGEEEATGNGDTKEPQQDEEGTGQHEEGSVAETGQDQSDEEMDDGDKDKSTSAGQTEGSDAILACAFSGSGRYLAVCDDNKQLSLWDASQDWTQISVRKMVRRGLAVQFTQSEETVVVGDKSGDVYTFSVTQPHQPATLILGHLSLLLDLVLADDDKYVITSDKDEKIRVSHYPNGYNIHNYCLGHTQFVSCLVYVERVGLLVSAGGDSTMRAWDVSSECGGKELCCVDCRDGLPQTDTEQDLTVSTITYSHTHNTLAVSIYKLADILLYKLDKQTSKVCLEFKQRLQCPDQVSQLYFDEAGYLWVLTGGQHRSLAVYYYSKEHSCWKQLTPNDKPDLEDAEEIVRVVSSINNCDLVQEKLEGENIFEHLHKLRMDTGTFMKDYYERKEQRIESCKEKYKESQKRRNRGGKRRNKKAKTDSNAVEAKPEPSEKVAKVEEMTS